MVEKLYTPSQACKILGIHINTLRRWEASGYIKCVRTPGNKRRIPESEIKRLLGEFSKSEKKVIGYARVSSQRQKDYLEHQVNKIKQKYPNAEIIKDIGSGLNENRKGFKKLLSMIINGEVSRVVVTHKDRLTRFGFKTIEKLFNALGVEIEVLENKELTPHEEFIEDLFTIIAHFSGRFYGMRRYGGSDETTANIQSSN